MPQSMWNIFDLAFWFDMTPVRMGSGFTVAFFVIFAALLITASASRIARRNAGVDKPMKHFLENVAGKTTTWGVIGFIWLFCSFEEISFFGSRFWFLCIAAGMLFSARKLYIQFKKEVPEERLRRTLTTVQNKYAPRRAR